MQFWEEKFGDSQLEDWMNVYETKNPLLKILKRPNLKGITLAKFLKEIEIWERDGQGNPVKDSYRKQKKMNLTGLVKIRQTKSANISKFPDLDLTSNSRKASFCTSLSLK